MGQIKSYPEQTVVASTDKFLMQDGASNATKYATATEIKTFVDNSNPYKFSVYRSAAQTMNGSGTGGGATKIQFDTELFDTNSNYDNATNYRYTAPVTGFYFFSANVVVNNATAANVDCSIRFYKNGSVLSMGTNLVGVSFPGLSLSDEIQLTAGDYIEVYFQNGNVNTSALFTGTAPIYTRFFGELRSVT